LPEWKNHHNWIYTAGCGTVGVAIGLFGLWITLRTPSLTRHDLEDVVGREGDEIIRHIPPTPPALVPSLPTPPAPPLPQMVEGRTLTQWEAVPLDSEGARKIPVFVRKDAYTDDAITAANSIVKKLDVAGFHRITDEASAALLIEVNETNQTSELDVTDSRPNQMMPFRWDTSIRIVVHFVHGKTLIDQLVTATKSGDVNSTARVDSMDAAVSNVCKIVFRRCELN
jgi:hypothetical protein